MGKHRAITTKPIGRLDRSTPPPSSFFAAFERRSALFALAVSDVVVVNMWAKDVGREAGASKPLLKTILQVNLKLFAASSAPSAPCERAKSCV